MNYPAWDVPHIGGPWVIGIIAIVHVMISHFAVGGGLYLPVAERKALRQGRRDWLPILRGHSKFFLILTAVWGTTTGVGIWFSIGLVGPEGTSTLIHNFVFGWAMEWTFFFIEITAAAVYYYTYGRVSEELHLKVGWLYAATSLMTLVIINGILSFMLTPGQAWLDVAGTGQEAAKFWNAFFNPTYWPSLLLRTLVCCSLAGVWAFFTASRIDGFKHPRLKTEIARFSALWLIPSFVLMPVGLLWYLYCVPAGQRALLELGINTIGAGSFTQITRMATVTIATSATIVFVVYLLAWRSARDFKPGHAAAIFLLAFAATGSTEYAREMLRKPYVVGDHMYSSGIRTYDVDRINQEGYLAHTPWLTEEERTADTPQAILTRGEIVFRGQCMPCHTKDGYRSMHRLLAGRDAKAIGQLLLMLHKPTPDSPYTLYMPPLSGTDEEIEALNAYLDHQFNASEAPAEENPPAPAEEPAPAATQEPSPAVTE